MPRAREPVDALLAKGKKHLTKEQIDQRRATEHKVPEKLRKVEPPEDILKNKKLLADFERYADMLSALLPDNFGQPDADTLSRYVKANQLYNKITRKLLRTADPDMMRKLQIMQDVAFKQAHTCANVLGMNVTSRCKLVVPNAEDDGTGEF